MEYIIPSVLVLRLRESSGQANLLSDLKDKGRHLSFAFAANETVEEGPGESK